MPAKDFPGLSYGSWLAIEEMCGALPTLVEAGVVAFFQEVGSALQEAVAPVPRARGCVFDSLVGPLGCAQGFTASTASEQGADGILTLNTTDFSSPVGLVFYVGRLSDSMFLTRGFVGSRRAKVLGRPWKSDSGFWQRLMGKSVVIPARHARPDAIVARYKGRDLDKSDQFSFRQELRECMTSYDLQAMILGKGISQWVKEIAEKQYEDLINDTKSALEWS